MTVALQEQFKIYHAENPQIYEAFEKYALIAAGRRKHFAALTIIHRIRWDSMISGNDEFKVNNNYAAYYGRLFEEIHPRQKDFFNKRTV